MLHKHNIMVTSLRIKPSAFTTSKDNSRLPAGCKDNDHWTSLLLSEEFTDIREYNRLRATNTEKATKTTDLDLYDKHG